MGYESMGKSIFALGLIAFMATQMFGSAPSINPGTTPVFQSPFAVNTYSSIVTPDANGTDGTTFVESVVGCDQTQYWHCLEQNDGDASYIVLNSTFDSFPSSPDVWHTAGYVNVHMANVTGGAINALTLTVWCRSVGNQTTNHNFHVDGNREYPITINCPLSDQYTPLHVQIDQMPQVWPLSEYVNASTGFALSFRGTGKVFVTYMELQVTQEVGQIADCIGNFFQVTGCQIGRFFTAFIKVFQFLFNGIIYIISWASYGISILVQAIGILVWLYSIPGMPTVVQLPVSAIVTALLAHISLNIAALIRGTAAGG